MARYIDADKLSKEVLASWDKDNHKTIEASHVHRQEHHHLMRIIEKQPIADVVPKSEAENYKKIAEHQQSVSMRRYFEIKQLKEELAKTKQEVAREIFEEIERTFKALLMGDITDIEKILAELKKKYTESEDKG